ncbi:RNA polymerase sigma factor [Nocardioides panzhihuensis]|uniref:DNA-directed RNA polymerase specialized sigma24 family protein n=1 Tax=Nocardioides panzhihuensis TaxID=860243 RepID=A0A7Z0DJ27_9ACTN|nr:sigma-70 family RNA polymerase sigma factor [Nocardioides panzhihuensis]NYI76258.1 DNA-directed RNA polymerase specialized sigma24 family protein [Nocardioides panzhihuensis]
MGDTAPPQEDPMYDDELDDLLRAAAPRPGPMADVLAHPADVRVLDLRSALERLKPIDQEILRLVHWDGLSLVETAELLGKRAGTVRSRYHRARSSLRRQLG